MASACGVIGISSDFIVYGVSGLIQRLAMKDDVRCCLTAHTGSNALKFSSLHEPPNTNSKHRSEKICKDWNSTGKKQRQRPSTEKNVAQCMRSDGHGLNVGEGHTQRRTTSV